MAGHYDPNPFAEEEVNPFSNPGGIPKNSRLKPLPPEPVGYNYDRTAPVDIPLESLNAADLRRKAKELEAKEIELKRREKDVRRLEEAAARAGIVLEVKNWPPCFPIIHHDIAKEIPIHLQRLQYVALSTYLGLFGCLVWNIISTTAAWIKGFDGRIWFISIIIFLISVPCAYIGWYRSLYRALRTDRSMSFGWFFLNYILHICFCIYAAVAPPFVFRGIALTGIFPALEVSRYSGFVGIFYFLGFAFFCAETLLSLWVIQRVYRYFRGSGQAAARREAARGARLP